MQPIIILGAGLAGWTTVRELRKLDTTTPIVLVTADAGDFYAKPSLSNALAQKRTPEQLVSTPAAAMAEANNIQLRAHTRVIAVDTHAHMMTVQSAAHSDTDADGTPQTLQYSQLVLATGAQAIRLPLAGDAADQVLSINTLDDFKVFYARLGAAMPSKTVVILGAGLIGCEFANDLVLAGHRVAVVDPAPRVLSRLLPAAASAQLQDALGAVGVQWHLGTTAHSVDATADQLTITLASGSTTIRADLVLSAVGLRANTALAAAAGIACEHGILVNDLLQTSARNVFALGDCAQYASAAQRTLPYVMPIMHAARALAATLAGNATPLVFPVMPVAVKTPALPTVVATPWVETAGQWEEEASAGAWRFMDAQHTLRGFVLTGKQTARRMELSKLTVV
jgi:rubredoxin---NAD+ reductase